LVVPFTHHEGKTVLFIQRYAMRIVDPWELDAHGDFEFFGINNRQFIRELDRHQDAVCRRNANDVSGAARQCNRF